MNNKFKGLYDTEGTSFISDKVEPINYYEPTIKTAKIQNHTYSINFDKTELYKEIENLQQELQRKDNIINMIIEQLYILRGLTFTKYKSNEWNNCLSWNDDIQPILDKINELEGKDE